jgi:DNA-directed RNA polymerase subunit RPC12/RpoP
MAIDTGQAHNMWCVPCGRRPERIEFVEMIDAAKPLYTIWNPWRCGNCGSERLVKIPMPTFRKETPECQK